MEVRDGWLKRKIRRREGRSDPDGSSQAGPGIDGSLQITTQNSSKNHQIVSSGDPSAGNRPPSAVAICPWSARRASRDSVS